MTAAYPLSWPGHIPRSKTRERSRFNTSLNTALKNVEGSLRLFSKESGKPLKNVVISSNVALGASNPADPGVAVWFVWDDLSVCFPVDRYQKVEHNLQAIHHIIEAERVKLRHGSLAIVRATFTGFQALPPPPGGGWRAVLGLGQDATRDEIERAFREKAKKAHPDAGGTTTEMQRLTDARDAGLRETR